MAKFNLIEQKIEARREDGQFLITNKGAAGLSALPSGFYIYYCTNETLLPSLNILRKGKTNFRIASFTGQKDIMVYKLTDFNVWINFF